MKTIPYGGYYMWIFNFLYENKDAIIALPQEVKIIILAALCISIGTSLIKSAFRFAKVLILVAAAYFLMNWLGIF